jgi:hypothetical protein
MDKISLKLTVLLLFVAILSFIISIDEITVLSSRLFLVSTAIAFVTHIIEFIKTKTNYTGPRLYFVKGDFKYGEYRYREKYISGRTITKATRDKLKESKNSKSMLWLNYRNHEYILINLCNSKTKQMDLAFGVLKVVFKFDEPVHYIKLVEGMTEDPNKEFPEIKINIGVLNLTSQANKNEVVLNIAYARPQGETRNSSSIHISRIYDTLHYRIAWSRALRDNLRDFMFYLSTKLLLNTIDITNVNKHNKFKFYIVDKFIKFSNCLYKFEITDGNGIVTIKALHMKFTCNGGVREKFECKVLNETEYNDYKELHPNYTIFVNKASDNQDSITIDKPFK